MKHFPNGFSSWAETHFDIVSFIEEILNTDNRDNTIYKRLESQGKGGLYELAEEWTDEFEKLHTGTEWDGGYIDTLEDFCINKNKP